MGIKKTVKSGDFWIGVLVGAVVVPYVVGKAPMKVKLPGS